MTTAKYMYYNYSMIILKVYNKRTKSVRNKTILVKSLYRNSKKKVYMIYKII